MSSHFEVSGYKRSYRTLSCNKMQSQQLNSWADPVSHFSTFPLGHSTDQCRTYTIQKTLHGSWPQPSFMCMIYATTEMSICAENHLYFEIAAFSLSLFCVWRAWISHSPVAKKKKKSEFFPYIYFNETLLTGLNYMNSNTSFCSTYTDSNNSRQH